MDMQVLPWIKDDVAIEIIGKMIAEQVEQLHQLVANYKQVGFAFNSQEVTSDPRYQQYMQRIAGFKAEIDQIYDGERLDELYKKVGEEYVPHLNHRQEQAPLAV